MGPGHSETRDAGDPAGGPARRREAWVTALLLVSGAAALVHESAWYRFLVPVLGAGALPAAAVSAGALLGLAVGSALGGRLADRGRSPALVLTTAEGAAALAGVLVPLAVPVLRPLSGAPGAVAAAVLLALAAVPMGASLPAAVRVVDPPEDGVGACFRRVYGWNTVGAVAGLFLSAAVLLEALGNRGAVLAAAGAEALVALGALPLARGARRPAPTRLEGPAPLAPRRARLAVAALLAGAAGLVVQVAWIRRLTPALGPTFQVFAVVLAVHLLGLALGSLVLGPRRGAGPSRVPAILAVASAVPVVLMPGLVDDLGRWAADAASRSAGGPWALLGIRALAAAAVLVPSTAIGAALLPWLLRAASPPREAAGRGAGLLLAANTAGSAVAALAAGLWWIPGAGTAGALRGAGGLLCAAGACVARTKAGAACAGVLAAALLLQPALLPLEDAAGRDALGASYGSFGFDPADAEPLAFEEGRVATVVVRDRDGRREFWVDGSIEASTAPTDRLHLALLADLPMALLAGAGVERPRVAVIGLGAGLTARGVARGDPASLDVWEIEPAVARAAPLFEGLGGGVPASARLHLEDGRRGVERAERSFDLVTSDPVHPAVAGSAWLYSVEHYRAVLASLSPEGIACQWVPLTQMALDDLRMVVRTFASEFRYANLFRAGPDAILVGGRRPLRVSETRLRAWLAGPGGEGLASLGLRSPGALLSASALGPAGCLAFGGEGPLNEDDRLLLELRCGRNAWDADPAANARILSHHRDSGSPPAALLDATATDAFLAEVDSRKALWTALDAFLDVGDPRLEPTTTAIAGLDARLAADPADSFASVVRDELAIADAFERVRRGDAKGAAVRARQVLSRGKAETVQRLDAAEVLIRAGEAAEGREVARSVAALHPWPRAVRLSR
jgi:spermidine synthase